MLSNVTVHGTGDILISFGLTFIEGFLAFLSPCILPMIPYLLYLGGQEGGEKNKGCA